MAARLKVDREILLSEVDIVLDELENDMAEVAQKKSDYDWKEDASNRLAHLTRALEEAPKSEQGELGFVDALYEAAREFKRDELSRQLRNMESKYRGVEDLKHLLSTTKEEFVSVSTGDEEFLWILRSAQGTKRTVN